MDRIHNKYPDKKPDRECTVLELADILLNMKTGIELNFSENKDGSDYWGAKKLVLFEQEIIIFGYHGGPALQMYECQKDVISDMVRHLCFHLNKQETDIVFLFEASKAKSKEKIQENIVSSFFFYMWNAWCKEECEKVFGWEFPHFWEKWCKAAKDTAWGAAEKYYADLSDGYRVKLVERACETYDGNTRKKN